MVNLHSLRQTIPTINGIAEYNDFLCRFCGGTEIQAGGRYKLLYPDDESFTLLVQKVEEADQGKWECRAGNKGGEVVSVAQLKITGRGSGTSPYNTTPEIRLPKKNENKDLYS